MTVRLPRRSTSRPLTMLAASPPMPMPSSVNPRAASETPSSLLHLGQPRRPRRERAPLTKKTAPIAAAARRGETGPRAGLA